MGEVIRAIVVDFDGVIVESNDIKTTAFIDVFSAYPEQLESMMAFHRANISMSRFQKFEHLVFRLLDRAGDKQLVDQLALRFSAATIERVVKCPFVPGAVEFLERYSPLVPMYLASVTPEADLLEILDRRGLMPFFRRVYACPPWTKRAAVADVLRGEQLPPATVVLVGDSPGDRDAARENSVQFIARDSGIRFDPPETLMFADMSEVSTALEDRISATGDGR